MLNSKILFELSKLPDLPIHAELKSDTEIRCIAIDRHHERRIVLADSLEAILDLYGLISGAETWEENHYLNDSYLEILFLEN